MAEPADVTEWEVRDLACFEYRTTMVIELFRVRCPDCGLRFEIVDQLPSKSPARRVARQFGLAESTVRAIDRRDLERWAATRNKSAMFVSASRWLFTPQSAAFVPYG